MLPYHTKITKYLFALFLILVLAYAYFEARNIFSGPVITIPKGEVTTESALVEIAGAVKNVTEITLDGRAIFVNEKKEFNEKLLLAPGVNRFEFVAKDKFGRERKEQLEVFYKSDNNK